MAQGPRPRRADPGPLPGGIFSTEADTQCEQQRLPLRTGEARLARTGTFCARLLYRLAIVPMHLPPLRRRGGDISLLATHFVQQACNRASRRASPCQRTSSTSSGARVARQRVGAEALLPTAGVGSRERACHPGAGCPFAASSALGGRTEEQAGIAVDLALATAGGAELRPAASPDPKLSSSRSSVCSELMGIATSGSRCALRTWLQPHLRVSVLDQPTASTVVTSASA